MRAYYSGNECWTQDWIQESYRYPDINDIIDQEERVKEAKKARQTGKSTNPMDKQNIQIKLVLGHFVSNEELKYLYQHSSLSEIADMDRLYEGRISAAGCGQKVSRGLDRGYSEGYRSDVAEINGTRKIIMVPMSTPDVNVDKNSTSKIHSVADVFQNNLHEDFGEAVRRTVETFPHDVVDALKVKDAVGVRYEGCKFLRTESSWDQRIDDFKVDVIVNVEVTLRVPAAHKCGEDVLMLYTSKKYRLNYRLRYTFDLYGKTGRKTCSGPLVMPAALFPSDMITMQKTWKTTDYLRPVIRRTDLPKLVRRMLKDIYPEAIEKPTAIDGDEFVEAMSEWLNRRYPGMKLRVREEWLGENGIRGQIFFADKTILYPYGSKGGRYCHQYGLYRGELGQKHRNHL